MSQGFRGVGLGLGLYNSFSIEQQKAKGDINQIQRVIEHGSNVISSLGIHGAAWGLGWELGRAITNLPGYHENVRVPLQRLFGVAPKKLKP